MNIIPKIIHQVWVGGAPLPDTIQSYINSWRVHHPDWEMRLWTDDDLPELQNQTAYDQTRILSQKSDILRYEILYQFGGLYVDTDFECLKSVVPILAAQAVYGDELPGRAGTAFIAAIPKHPVIGRAVAALSNGLPWKGDPVEETGPGLLHRTINRSLRSYSTCAFIDPQTTLKAGHYLDIGRGESLLALEPWTIYPYYLNQLWNPTQHPNAYAAHHWHASWR